MVRQESLQSLVRAADMMVGSWSIITGMESAKKGHKSCIAVITLLYELDCILPVECRHLKDLEYRQMFSGNGP